MGERRPINPKRGLLLLLGTALMLWVVYWLGLWLYYDDWKKGADFGNAFGAANAIFSGLALAALIFAIFLQHGELLAAHDGLKIAVDAQESTEALLRKTMEADIIIKLFETFRESRERHLEYSGPDLLWSWEAFNHKYATEREKYNSYEYKYLADYAGFFELCGILLRQGYIGESLVKVLPRATPLWVKAQELVQGLRSEEGNGLWGSWEYFAARQAELARSL